MFPINNKLILLLTLSIFDKVFRCQELKLDARLDLSSVALIWDAQDLSLNRHT